MRVASRGDVVADIRSWIERNLGLQFGHERSLMVEQRLELVCRKRRVSLTGLRQRLDSGDHELSLSVAEELSTNHTLFLREPEMFATYREAILPSLAGDAQLRIWSAASSSGEEAYSIAMSSIDALGATAAEQRIRILGTDISEQKVRHAERGVFTRRQVLDHAPDHLSFFVDHGTHELRVRDDVARLCVFRRMNLTHGPWPFQQRFQVIFLRNVLYYFDAEVQRLVIEACFRATEPGGWLVTSVTEPMIGAHAEWIQLAPGLFRKPGGWSP